MQYDEYQQEAIDALGGYHLILSPPGCGKTDILSRRIERAHELGVSYSEMACLTFTNRASKGMQERVVRNTGEPVPSDLFIGNVHRLCATFLFENGLIPQNTAIIDEFDFENIVHDLAAELIDEAWGQSVSPHGLVNLQHALRQVALGVPESEMLHGESLDDVRAALHHLVSTTGSDTAYVYEHIEELWMSVDDYALSLGVRMIRLARSYEEYKIDNDMLDYDDLIVRTYDEIHGGVGYHKYKWIQVDEVQDLSPAQLAIVDLFTADEDPTVVYLGDEQQAIFSFIGAKMETLEMLRNRCKGNIHRLFKNYRSPRYLLEVVNAYAVQQLNIDPSLLPTTDNQEQSGKDTLYVLQADTIADEYAMVVRQALGYSRKESGRIAVIVPYNSHADKVSEAFMQQQIPHFKISGTDLFSTPTVQTLFAHLAIAQNEGGFTSWAKLLYHSKIIDRYTDARNFMRTMRKIGMSPTDFIYYDQSSYLSKFSEAYDNREIVIFDTETTGLDIYNDEIIQIAAVKVRGSQLVEGSQFNIFLDITREIPPVLKGDKVNPMVEQYALNPHVGRREGLTRFLDYCQGCVLVGHNVEYDYHILDYNLRRDCPEVNLSALFPEYYDTLKYIRLVEPRQRHYSLEKLLEALHLEGANSHMADDDIMATKSLLDYCRQHAEVQLQRQQQFFADSKNLRLANKIRDRYGRYYLHTRSLLYEQEPERIVMPLLVKELQHTYEQMTADSFVAPIDKWHYIIDYLVEDVINPVSYTSLKEQLSHYNGDLLTCKEADLCGSKSLKEQFFVSTVHKAKGLEFESVIIFEANRDKYPHPKSTTLDAVQEDARKFYVALSRAKRRLCITCTKQPTPFLDCIKDLFYWYAQPDGKWQLVSQPQSFEAHTARMAYRNGAKLRQLGKVRESIPYFLQAVQMNPAYHEALLQLADIHLLLGNKSEFEQYLAQVQTPVDVVEALPYLPMEADEVESIESKMSKQQEAEPVVMYHPNPYFEQRESYPLVSIPALGQKVLLPRKGRSKVRGYKVLDFAAQIKSTIPGIFVNTSSHIAIPGSKRPYEPAIIIFNGSLNLFIDVEIDAPYEAVFRYATHEQGNRYDTSRDAYLSANGWMVVRFSERQVQFQPYECVMFLYDIVNSALNGMVPRTSNLALEPRWTATQAMRWERELLREHYLGIAAFEPYDFTTKVVVENADPELLVFDEESLTYAPPVNRTGSADYLSVTTLIGRFFPFDSEAYIERRSRDERRPIEEVRAELEAIQFDASDRGTRLHEDIEHFLKGETIHNDSVEYGYFQQFYRDKLQPGLEFVDAEKMIFLPDYNVAGTVDALFRRKRDGAYIMVDWKRSTHLILDDGRVHKYGHGRGLSILGHLDASSYYQYELQQSFYKYILAQRYNIHVEHMVLCVLHPEYPRYYTIRLENYREREVKAILSTINLNQ